MNIYILVEEEAKYKDFVDHVMFVCHFLDSVAIYMDSVHTICKMKWWRIAVSQ